MCFSEELGANQRKIFKVSEPRRSSTPRSLFSQEYSRISLNKIRYEGRSEIKHLLMNVEMHLTANLKEIVSITSRSDEREIREEISEHVLARQDGYWLRIVTESAIAVSKSHWITKDSKLRHRQTCYVVPMPYRHKVMLADEKNNFTEKKLTNDAFIV